MKVEMPELSDETQFSPDQLDRMKEFHRLVNTESRGFLPWFHSRETRARTEIRAGGSRRVLGLCIDQMLELNPDAIITLVGQTEQEAKGILKKIDHTPPDGSLIGIQSIHTFTYSGLKFGNQQIPPSDLILFHNPIQALAKIVGQAHADLPAAKFIHAFTVDSVAQAIPSDQEFLWGKQLNTWDPHQPFDPFNL